MLLLVFQTAHSLGVWMRFGYVLRIWKPPLTDEEKAERKEKQKARKDRKDKKERDGSGERPRRGLIKTMRE